MEQHERDDCNMDVREQPKGEEEGGSPAAVGGREAAGAVVRQFQLRVSECKAAAVRDLLLGAVAVESQPLEAPWWILGTCNQQSKHM